MKKEDMQDEIVSDPMDELTFSEYLKVKASQVFIVTLRNPNEEVEPIRGERIVLNYTKKFGRHSDKG